VEHFASAEPLFSSFGALVRPAASAGSLRALCDVSPADFRSLIFRSGVVLFRGFDADLAAFTALTKHVNTAPLEHTIRYSRKTVGDDDTIVAALPGRHHIALHGEMYYMPRHPDLLWFMCQTAPTQGGETTLCNGARFLEALPSATREAFEGRKIRYRHVRKEADWQRGFGVQTADEVLARLRERWGVEPERAKVDGDGNLSFDVIVDAIVRSKDGTRRAFVNALCTMRDYFAGARDASLLPPTMSIRVAWEDGSPIAADMLAEIDRIGEGASDLVSWRPGDVVVIDNSWVLHGRRPFEGTRELASCCGLAE